MKPWIITALAACTAAALTMGSDKPRVEDLGWFAGDWECEVWGGTFEERWSSPSGGTMIGMGRHLKAGKTEFMEFMTVESSGGEITMWILLGSPSKGPKTGVPFKLTSMNAQEVVFENPSNEFPSKIIYKRGGNGRMTARIEGVQAGKPAAQDFNFRRSR